MYFGAAIGRVAGRISNGTFTLDGRSYDLVRNDGPNHLHGGILGFDKKIWDVEATRNENGEPSLVFLCTSFDGEEGYPGTVHVRLTYTVSGRDLRTCLSMSGSIRTASGVSEAPSGPHVMTRSLRANRESGGGTLAAKRTIPLRPSVPLTVRSTR